MSDDSVSGGLGTAGEYALLRSAVDAMIDPQALVEAVRGPDGQVTDFTFREVNPAACEYLQRHREDLLGAGMIEVLPDIVESGLFARYVDCVRTGEPLMVEAEFVKVFESSGC